jgi:hypothetical protein
MIFFFFFSRLRVFPLLSSTVRVHSCSRNVYTSVHMCVCVCVCVDRERTKERKSDKEKKTLLLNCQSRVGAYYS